MVKKHYSHFAAVNSIQASVNEIHLLWLSRIYKEQDHRDKTNSESFYTRKSLLSAKNEHQKRIHTYNVLFCFFFCENNENNVWYQFYHLFTITFQLTISFECLFFIKILCNKVIKTFLFWTDFFHSQVFHNYCGWKKKMIVFKRWVTIFQVLPFAVCFYEYHKNKKGLCIVQKNVKFLFIERKY